MAALQIVWFKRDLRIVDHQPLAAAVERGLVLPLYVVEPELWRQPDASQRQWMFCRESLLELRQALADRGQPLVVRAGDVVQVLERARRQFGIDGLWSHEETGSGWTYQRDKRVGAWARRHGIAWTEIPQFGVTRRMRSRNGWAKRWEVQMTEPITPVPAALHSLEDIDLGVIPERPCSELLSDACPQRQIGGRSIGLEELNNFLQHRAPRYQRSMSSPNTAFTGCSRLSAYLTWGCLSMREVLQTSRSYSGRGVSSFESRLHWHCHFIQKLEDQSAIEFSDFHPFMRGIRAADAERLTAWSEGRTGVPLWMPACVPAGPWLDQLPHAGDVDVFCQLQPLAALERQWPASGPSVCGLRTGGFTGASARCSRAAPRSTRFGSTTRSSRAWTTTPQRAVHPPVVP